MILIFLMIVNLFPNYSDKDWHKKIIPLVSDRKFVETILGKPIDENCSECIYIVDKEKILVNYAIDKCRGKLSGWNVPKDTVLSFSIEPSESPTKFSITEGKKHEYLIVSSDDFTSKYIDPKRGIIYKVSDLKKLEEIVFLPAEDKIDKRCKGFPAYSIAGITYRPAISFADSDIEYGKSIIENHLIDLKLSESNLITYLVIYSGENLTGTRYKKYLSEINKFLETVPKLTLARVKVISNIKKEKFQVDIFSLPSNYPPPVPEVVNDKRQLNNL